jgi:hypothetical protein
VRAERPVAVKEDEVEIWVYQAPLRQFFVPDLGYKVPVVASEIFGPGHTAGWNAASKANRHEEHAVVDAHAD